MKAYTDIEQSKKLADILPLESADGFYEAQINPFTNKWEDILFVGNEWASDEVVIPAWSLSALLAIIPYPTLGKHADETWSCASWVEKVNPYFVEGCDTPIDACYEMIIKLHELKIL